MEELIGYEQFQGLVKGQCRNMPSMRGVKPSDDGKYQGDRPENIRRRKRDGGT